MLSLDVITLGVPEVQAARAFYTAMLAPSVADHGHRVVLDLHGTGQVALCDAGMLAADAETAPATSGFRGYIVSYVVPQPSEVEAILGAAAHGGANVLKPAKRGFFGGFSAVCQAPDGAIWKLSAPTRKDTGPALDPPRPTETAALLGVAEPKASSAFYTALGMTVDRDYGTKYIDFRPAPGACRLGLMTRKALAKDVGARDDGSGFPAAVFTCNVESRGEVDALLNAAAAAGGKIAVPPRDTASGGYAGHFIDPDGFLWKVASAS